MIFRVRTVCGIYPHTVIQFPGFTLKFCPVYGVQFSYFLRQTLTKDPQQVWQTLKNFDYPISILSARKKAPEKTLGSLDFTVLFTIIR